jgi:sirohydrochlorin ferrochelatase
MSPTHKTAIILIDHGSRLEEANRVLEETAERLQSQLPDHWVQPAHMELAEPSIEEAFAVCAAQGAREIIVFPYFLGPGKHSSRDIPALCQAAGRNHPQLTYRIVDPLGVHEKIVEIIRERVGH